MRAASRAGVVPKAVIAAIVGSIAGGTAGVWSLRHPTASVHVAEPIRATSPVATQPATTTPAPDIAAASATPTPGRVAPTPQPIRAGTNAAASPPKDAAAPVAPPETADEAHLSERARALARRPDVTALLALRDEVVRRAAERGTANSPPVKSVLDELDQRLNEARTLQLKLDAEEFRKADSKRPR